MKKLSQKLFLTSLSIFTIVTFLQINLTFAEPPTQPSLENKNWLNKITPLENLDFVITPEEDHAKLIHAFQSAKNNIKVGIFGISSKIIADELQAAILRGIPVTVICDKYCISNPKRLALFDRLKSAGATMVIASSGFSITHWKMFIIDDSKVFISTMNFISRFYQMRDLGIFTTEKSILKEVLAVYNQDLENAKNQTSITPELSSAHLIWSPINAETKLSELILSASKTIEIWIENMGNPQIHLALKTAVERKVKVRVLTSVCGLGMSPEDAYKKLNELKSFGVTVHAMPFPGAPELPYIHAKTINVDHENVFIGSENFSYNSLVKARELGLVLKDPSLQSKMTEYFEKDWAKSIPLTEKPPESCEALSPSVDILDFD